MQNSGSMSSLLKPGSPTPTDTIEQETKNGHVDSKDLNREEQSGEQSDLESSVQQEKGVTEERSEFDVWWNEPANEDPSNPMSWPEKKKWLNIGVMSFVTFLTLVYPKNTCKEASANSIPALWRRLCLLQVFLKSWPNLVARPIPKRLL